MNPISAAVQNPTPKPDREVGPSNANGDTPQQGPGCESAFGSVLREISGGRASSPADTDAVKGKPDDADSDAPPVAAEVVVAPAPAAPASSAAAILANLLSLALPALAAADSKVPAPVQARSNEAPVASAAESLSASMLGSTGASAGTSSGSASTPIRIPPGDAKAHPASARDAAPTDRAADAKDIAPADSEARKDNLTRVGTATRAEDVAQPDSATRTEEPPRADIAARTDITKVLQTAAAKIEVLGRAVHFKPVVPGGPPAPDAAPAGQTKPATTEVGAEIATATPQIAKPEIPTLNAAAAALKLAPQIRSEPDPRRAVAAASDGEGEQPAVIAPAQGRAVSGVERAVLAAVGERAEDSSAASAAPRDGNGTATSLPAGSLPLIATAIREELQRATAAAAQGSLPADPGAGAVPAGPLRTLKIQLRPEELGVVTVEMRLSNGLLETHLRASQPETAALLHKDTAILTDLLSNSSYRAEVSVGQARSADAGGSGGSQQQASQQQAASSFADGGARPGNEGARQRQDAQRQATTTRREGERTDEAVRPRDGGIYL
ncbi:flagellar hook-length control protein FliK [Methylobacterium pseudosasicola]|uniref:Flagellar hook-length control protein FliK n=1 Tax=Methylobacterium pseudosasicola TaxID=582667 RepID=A0A1I4RPY0_9HYPH|nr:flagellar hook-length control protein FliK [Methylobacterium pseudosasicola]SFM54040.1 Flagellar hook-length control protein FliK [Methylobacterium pseudosasicola]